MGQSLFDAQSVLVYRNPSLVCSKDTPTIGHGVEIGYRYEEGDNLWVGELYSFF